MLANGNNHYVFNCQFAPKSQWPDKRKTLLRFQTFARHLKPINKGDQKPIGHLVRMRQLLLKISPVFCHDLILKSAYLEHPNFAIGLAEKKFAKFCQQPRRKLPGN